LVKKGSPKPPPKNRDSAGRVSLREIQPAGFFLSFQGRALERVNEIEAPP
jgi:hypothetical protein